MAEPAERAAAQILQCLSPALRAKTLFFYAYLRVTLAKPRSTLGYMLQPASRAMNQTRLIRSAGKGAVGFAACVSKEALTFAAEIRICHLLYSHLAAARGVQP